MPLLSEPFLERMRNTTKMFSPKTLSATRTSSSSQVRGTSAAFFFSRLLTSICVAESINVFFPFIVFKKRTNCREFNDAISTASFIFCYCILSISRTAKKSVVLCLNLYLFSLYSSGSTGKSQTYQSAQESTPVLSECKWHAVGFEYRVHYFIGVGFNSPHEYYVLSPQSF